MRRQAEEVEEENEGYEEETRGGEESQSGVSSLQSQACSLKSEGRMRIKITERRKDEVRGWEGEAVRQKIESSSHSLSRFGVHSSRPPWQGKSCSPPWQERSSP